MTNKDTNTKVDNEFDEKAHSEQLGLKQEIMRSQAKVDKCLNAVANKNERLDVGKINS